MQTNPLNILHTIGLDQMYPTIRCQLTLAGKLNLARFRQAVTLTAQVVPELFCGYDLATNHWHPLVQDTNLVVQKAPLDATDLDATPDWEHQPQLRCWVQYPTNQTIVTLTMSHILTDGSGFKQYLYLLCDCYNRGAAAIEGVHNTVNIDWLKALVRAHPQAPVTASVDHPDKPLALPRLAAKMAPRRARVSGLRLGTTATQALIQATHRAHVTVNDVLMATFGQTIQAYQPTATSIALACPTDMRSWITNDQAQLRIANHTARYNPVIATTPTEPISQVIQKMHRAMATLKSQAQFLDSVRSLLQNYQTQPLAELRQIVEANYHVRAIAYTNFGIIDDRRLRMAGLPVIDCLMTGSFRTAPMFQAVGSTFQGRLSLAFNMVGTPQEAQFGRDLIQAMNGRIQAFVAGAAADTVI